MVVDVTLEQQAALWSTAVSNTTRSVSLVYLTEIKHCLLNRDLNTSRPLCTICWCRLSCDQIRRTSVFHMWCSAGKLPAIWQQWQLNLSHQMAFKGNALKADTEFDLFIKQDAQKMCCYTVQVPAYLSVLIYWEFSTFISLLFVLGSISKKDKPFVFCLMNDCTFCAPLRCQFIRYN